MPDLFRLLLTAPCLLKMRFYMDNSSVVELINIKKHFGEIKANDGVDLTVRSREIHAILGENGSGKSTLMNILSGLYRPDHGKICIRGKEVDIHTPRDAAALGIGMIHQHFKLVEALSAWENIVGGMRDGLFLNKKKVIGKIRELSDLYGLSVIPEKKVSQMTIGEKQTVEILKALYRGADILILDEPTAVLTSQETDRLFQILKEMRQKGCSVILITHKLQEVIDISDRVTVLRKGRTIGSLPTSEADAQLLASMMVGREMDLSIPYENTEDMDKHIVLSIRNLSLHPRGNRRGLSVSELEISSHEILGIAGVADSGQKELCEAIAGLIRVSGSITLNGKEISSVNPVIRKKEDIHMGFVPEDRLGMGLIEGMSITDNVALRSAGKAEGIFIDRKARRDSAVKLISDYGVSAAGPDQEIQALSGGNIQKILLGREIENSTDFLIAAYPVRGLDVGASDFIYEKLNEQKKKGAAILFVGEDLDIMLGICDRIAVLHNGTLMGVVSAKDATKREIGLMMMGERREDQDAAV